jgi:hypothetical protein
VVAMRVPMSKKIGIFLTAETAQNLVVWLILSGLQQFN